MEEDFPKHVQSLSPTFVEIFKQAAMAEKKKLDHIAGVGYGKALEFLVKDYLVDKNSEDKDLVEKIKQKSLGKCIADNVDDERIKKAASGAKLLRNDETHYERKVEDKDVQDLKDLIQLTVYWIEAEKMTENL